MLLVLSGMSDWKTETHQLSSSDEAAAKSSKSLIDFSLLLGCRAALYVCGHILCMNVYAQHYISMCICYTSNTNTSTHTHTHTHVYVSKTLLPGLIRQEVRGPGKWPR